MIRNLEIEDIEVYKTGSSFNDELLSQTLQKIKDGEPIRVTERTYAHGEKRLFVFAYDKVLRRYKIDFILPVIKG